MRATQLFLWFADQWVVNYWKRMGVLLVEALKERNPPVRAALLATSEFLLPFRYRWRRRHDEQPSGTARRYRARRFA